MTALLITLAAWFVLAPALALVLGGILHQRDAQIPGGAERAETTTSAPAPVPVAPPQRSSAAA